MEGKKKYVAIILFLLICLSLFTFANPQEEEKKLDNGKEDKEEVENNDSSKEDEKEDTPSKEEDKDNSVIVENNKDKGNNNTVKNNGYDKALKAVLVAENSLSSVDSEVLEI